MATIRSMRHGRLHILEDGMLRACWGETGITNAVGFVSNGVPVVLGIDGSNDVVIKSASGGHFLTLNNTAATQAIDASVDIGVGKVISALTVYQSGSNTHLWMAAGTSGSESVYYAKSTNGGSTWTAPAEVIALGGGGSWNDNWMKPIGFYTDSTSLFLYVLGNDGSTSEVGRWSVPIAADYAVSGNYTASSNNPLWPGTDIGDDAGLVDVGDRLWLYYHSASNSNDIYVAQGVKVSGIDEVGGTVPTFTPNTPIDTSIGAGSTQHAHNHVLKRGFLASLDDAGITPHQPLVHENVVYMFYTGNDGSNTRPMVAIADESAPDAWYKVGGMREAVDETDMSEVYYCLGDLTWADAEGVIHTLDRGGPGAAIDAPHEPFDGTFSFRLERIGTNGDAGASGSDSRYLWEHLFQPTNFVRLGFSNNKAPVKMNHILYRVLDDAGADDSFALFPACVVAADLSEAAEGDVVSARFTCHATRRPIYGQYT